jgi:Leucine-rich repeat (LRR) protein
LALSLYSNLINELPPVIAFLEQLPELKVLWLNENPISKHSFEALRNTIETSFARIEILNSNFTKNASDWAFKFITFN